jgi:macrolide transport system ATP-binding/permease protein
MPDWTRLLAPRLDALKFSPARQAEIIEELSQHLDDRVAELAADGMPQDLAERRAVDELSDQNLLVRGLGRLRQAHVGELPVFGAPRRRWLADFWQDVRYGGRALRAHPGFTAAAVLTLTLGIGANTAIFSLVNAVMFRPWNVQDPSSLAYVQTGPAGGVFSYPDIVDLRDKNDVFTGLIAWAPIVASLNADGTTDQVPGFIVSGNFFELLGVHAARGRALAPSDDVTPGAHPVAVISHGLWQRWFGGRTDILNHPVLINGQRFTIVGVLDAGFRTPDASQRDVYVPMMMQAVARPPRAGFAGEMNPDLLQVRGNSWVFAMGRLKPGVSADAAAASLSALMTSLVRSRTPNARERRIYLWGVDQGIPGQRARVTPVANLLLSVVGAVLLIACANVANLLLSRAASRKREIAIRLAIGASRWRLIRQFLTESVLLALVGGAGGVLLAWGIAAGFAAAPPPPGALPVGLDFAIDQRVLLFTLALSILTGLVFGLAPAIRASRPRLVPSLKDDAFVPDERSRRWNLRKGLVVIEVALSLILVVAAGLFVRSLRETQAISPGFDTAQVLDAQLNINLLRYTTAQGGSFYEQVVERVTRVPGVEAASLARIQVFRGGRVQSLAIEGRAASNEIFQSNAAGISAGARPDEVNGNVITPGYFRTMGIPILRGRDFGTADAPQAERVAIVNQAFVRLHFPNEDPLGRRISFRGPNGPWETIVGIVADSKYRNLLDEFTPIAYSPLSQNHETGMSLYVRSSVPPETLVSTIRREVQAIEPNLPVPNIQPMAETIGTSLYAARMGAWLIGVLGGLALLLSAIGVYGVLAFSIARRTRELGIRVALGADRRDIFSLILREGLGLVAIGIAVGLAGAIFGVKPLTQFLVGIGARDPISFVVAPVVLVLVALAACLIPARRAMKVQPTIALKT